MTLPILITGATRGLGFAIAETLAPVAPIIAVGTTVGALEDLDDAVKAGGGEATLAPINLTDPNAVAHLTKSTQERWGGIQAWIHTAIHAAPLTPAHQMNEKDWNKSFALNANAMGYLVKAFAPLLGKSGTAVFFDDTMIGRQFVGAYGASKSAQIAFVKSWADETKNIGPNVKILTPNPMPTALRARFFPGEDRAKLANPKDEAKRLMTEAGLL